MAETFLDSFEHGLHRLPSPFFDNAQCRRRFAARQQRGPMGTPLHTSSLRALDILFQCAYFVLHGCGELGRGLLVWLARCGAGKGAIGNGISLAIGVAAARKNGKVVLFESDGSLLMHIQELIGSSR
jgi:Thiamine pyrophosphate enzyme, C-terminal TPP binding domain